MAETRKRQLFLARLKVAIPVISAIVLAVLVAAVVATGLWWKVGTFFGCLLFWAAMAWARHRAIVAAFNPSDHSGPATP